ncbi:TetR/AcrR family transcriptional regulator [Phycicoccus sp. Soil803]|uniref:TetR/AcrR family transcriptional regulator n=1 Tax=Phycicoccus sp. Soil803 TaxID=1736415 RepID=UPI0007089E82|nr:TetR/AcrR family transcriptional regulator [Phycicoccus sp. Soil803]KRF21822.1 TetR family transcriptional regulator [Phycicoccus sp. Soil803]
MSSRTGARGPYRKGIERRREIIAAAAELFAEDGYKNSSVRELARRLGLTQAGVLHHFSDKEELLVEVLELRDTSVSEYLAALPDTDLPSRSRAVGRYSAQHEGLTSLFIMLSAEAIDSDHPAHDYFTEHYRATADVANRLPETDFPDPHDGVISADLIATLERAVQDGLQLQRRYREDLDAEAALDAFWHLVAAARHAWVIQD